MRGGQPGQPVDGCDEHSDDVDAGCLPAAGEVACDGQGVLLIGPADAGVACSVVRVGELGEQAGGEVADRGGYLCESERGYRTLPLDASLVAALGALRDRQVTEAMEAGPEAYTDSGYVVADELGRPVHPDWFSDEFHRVRERAGLPAVRLHDTRHSINSLMAAAGIPAHVRAAWCGHTVAVNESTYTHARPEDMAAGLAAVTRIHNGM